VDIKPLPEAITPIEACTLVIFGGSGDLARRRLIPAVYTLLLDGLLPDKYAVIGLGRKPMTDAEFRNLVREGVIAHSRQALVEDTWQAFERHLFYIQGENEDAQTYSALRAKAEQIEQTMQEARGKHALVDQRRLLECDGALASLRDVIEHLVVEGGSRRRRARGPAAIGPA
jgi:glucose-6-phosphate 1-dehydrogenase